MLVGALGGMAVGYEELSRVLMDCVRESGDCVVEREGD